MHRTLLVALLAAAGLALAAAPAPYAGLSAAARVHLALAAGLAPLMLTAMLWFVPVLTRTAAAPLLLLLAPAGALAGGLAVAAAFAGAPVPLALAALPAIAAALAVLGWSTARARACLGRPHPGLTWYQAALALWLAGLLLVPAMTQWPIHAPALRRAHLHLNLLGFVGLTVFGTLAVLLPTVRGSADPGVVPRLRRDLPVGIGASVLVALAGAGSAVPATTAPAALAALAGAAGWLWLWGRQVAALRRLAAGAPAEARSALLPLAVALAGWGVLLVHGGAHALGALAARPALAALLGGVLPALLTGAGAQLLPLWWWPGAPAARIAAARAGLVRGHGRRGALYCAAGLAALADAPGALVAGLALAGVADFALAAHRARRRPDGAQLSR